MTQLSEFVSQLALPEKWTLHVNYVDEADQLSIATGHFTRWLFEGTSENPGFLGLCGF